MNIEDIIMELKHNDGTPDCSVLEVIECLEQAQDTISDLETKVEELRASRDWPQLIDTLAAQEATITELTAEVEYWKGRTENGSNAKHWPEFGPSGG